VAKSLSRKGELHESQNQPKGGVKLDA
jgi:hypothetical protein